MNHGKFLVLLVGTLVLAAPPAHAQVQQAVKICEDVGLFQLFLQQNLTVTGNCDDPDHKVVLVMGPAGPQLRGLASNPPIPMTLTNDMRATVSGVTQYGVQDHDGVIRIVNGGKVRMDFTSPSGSCTAYAANGSRCLYEVVQSNSIDLLPGDKMCGPCSAPATCPDYGNNFINVYVQGTPVYEASVKLNRVSASCSACGGNKGFVPVKN